MAITTNYAAYNSYTARLYNGVGSAATIVAKPDGATTQTTAATTLRESAGVEVTLSPAALKALADVAAAHTADTEEAVTAKLRAVLSDIFIDSLNEAQSAGKAQPMDNDPAHKAVAQQATNYLAGETDANPFAGKSLDALAAIVIDASGRYTTNERRAAFTEFSFLDGQTLEAAITPKTAAAQAAANQETPKSGDLARIASAQAATAFATGAAKDNPFAGKTRDELTAIVANDTGDYTINERRAAMTERNRLEQVVRDGLSKTPDEAARRIAANEKPASSDPQRLDVARQATRFAYGLSPNPFTGLMPAELNNIIYDETKSYTTNERRAALAELTRLSKLDGADDAQSATPTNPLDALVAQIDPFSGSDGAYSAMSMGSILRARNTATLLSLIGGEAGGGAGGSSGPSSLLSMLSA